MQEPITCLDIERVCQEVVVRKVRAALSSDEPLRKEDRLGQIDVVCRGCHTLLMSNRCALFNGYWAIKVVCVKCEEGVS